MRFLHSSSIVSYPPLVTDTSPPAIYVFGSGVGGTAALDLATMVVAVCTSRSPIADCIHYNSQKGVRQCNIPKVYDDYVKESKTGNVEIIGDAGQVEFVGLWYDRESGT